MRRRRLLCAASALAPLAVAGCVGDEGVPNASAGSGADERLVLEQVRVDRGTELPLSVSGTVTEPSFSEGPRLRIALANDGDRGARLFTGAPPPFAVMYATPAGDGAGDERYLLWTDAYRESDHVFTEGRRVTGGEDIGLIESVPAGERVAETYELVGGPPPGDYVVEWGSTVTVGESEDDEVDFSYRLDLRVE